MNMTQTQYILARMNEFPECSIPIRSVKGCITLSNLLESVRRPKTAKSNVGLCVKMLRKEFKEVHTIKTSSHPYGVHLSELVPLLEKIVQNEMIAKNYYMEKLLDHMLCEPLEDDDIDDDESVVSNYSIELTSRSSSPILFVEERTDDVSPVKNAKDEDMDDQDEDESDIDVQEDQQGDDAKSAFVEPDDDVFDDIVDLDETASADERACLAQSEDRWDDWPKRERDDTLFCIDCKVIAVISREMFEVHDCHTLVHPDEMTDHVIGYCDDCEVPVLEFREDVLCHTSAGCSIVPAREEPRCHKRKSPEEIIQDRVLKRRRVEQEHQS
jgi:hypothetical protein